MFYVLIAFRLRQNACYKHKQNK